MAPDQLQHLYRQPRQDGGSGGSMAVALVVVVARACVEQRATAPPPAARRGGGALGGRPRRASLQRGQRGLSQRGTRQSQQRGSRSNAAVATAPRCTALARLAAFDCCQQLAPHLGLLHFLGRLAGGLQSSHAPRCWLGVTYGSWEGARRTGSQPKSTRYLGRANALAWRSHRRSSRVLTW